ncbi:YqaJ viral recombinase family protein [Delftia acidovorans]|uniref:YqaJ viral recombinase family protein n=1 Tax=Delftia acidovorans TaxID=80866 RepID=UPI0035A13B39
MIITNRKTHLVQQGSQEWLSLRTGYPTASEAPAAQGVSRYQTRSELIRQKATGITPEHDAHALRRFAEGHEAEAAARPLAEEFIGDELSPVTMTADVDGLSLLASLDGLVFDGAISWECKLWNESLAEQVRTNNLAPNYTVQMDQQQLVSGAARTLFTCTDGTPERTVHCWYRSSDEKKAAIVTHWRQLAQEVAAYVPSDTGAAPVVAEPVESLPTLAVQMHGSLQVVNNLPAFGDALRSFIDKMVPKPATDQEFADAEAECRMLKDAEKALDAGEASALAQIEDVELFRRTVAALRNLARSTRLAREKLVAAEKESRKAEIVASAQANLDQHIAALNQQRLGANWIPRVAGGFAEAIRGKKSLDNMRDAIAVVLTNAKADANALAGRLEANRQHLRQDDSDWIALFADFAAVGGKAPEDFQALAALRIGQHRQAEAKRLEAERERIRQEEEARAQRAAAAEAARAAAEQTRQLEAERARIRQEEQQRADAEAREKLAQANAQAQAGIAEGREAGALSAPLLDDLSATANHVHDSGVAALDTQQAISTAQASSAAAAPAAEDAGATITLGQLNALLKAENLSVKVSAETLDDQGLPYRKERGAVLVLVSDAKRMALKLALGFEKFAHALTAPA